MKHIKFMDECIAKAKLTFGGSERSDDLKLRYNKELQGEFYNLLGIVLREVDGMCEADFDSIMYNIRFTRRTIAIHNPDDLEWSKESRMYRKTKTFTKAKDDILNQEIKNDSSVYSD
jgi:hypothetical protein